jgi:hypothetical protein
LIRIVGKREQGADRLDVEAQFARMADKSKPVQIRGIVASPIVFLARRFRQQAYLFVVADRRYFHAAALCGNPDGDILLRHGT